MDLPIILIGAIASIASAPVGGYLRGLFLRSKGAGRISVESDAGVVEVPYKTDEEASDVAQRVQDAVVEVEPSARTGHRSTHGSSQPRPVRFQITLVELIYGIALLVGIAAKAAWDFSDSHGKIGINWNDTWGAFLVAPIVYVGVFATLKPIMSSVTLVGLGIAFQNGFFWQTVFAKQQGST